jgi:hypothetical protein
LQVTEFLKALTLKVVVCRVGRNVIMVDQMKLIPFSKQDMKAVCDSFNYNLQVDTLAF